MIRAHVTDVAVLAAIAPGGLATYLQAAGWRLVRRSDVAAFWERPTESGDAEILQPLSQALRDYALRMSDALVVLAAVENRSELDILRQIAEDSGDVLGTDDS